MFYDVKAQKYLESSINSNRTVVLKASKGYVVSLVVLPENSSWKIDTLIKSEIITATINIMQNLDISFGRLKFPKMCQS